MSCSNNGGTLTLPSPTHVHHVDVGSAVRSLRRSLSRSPSKFRLITRSPSASPAKSPLSPTPPNRAVSTTPSTTPFGNPSHISSPLAVPFPPSAKLALRSSTRPKSTTLRPSSSRRTSPKSPAKRERVLSNTSDTGNITPLPCSAIFGGQENMARSKSPGERRSFERSNRISFHADTPAPINHALSRLNGDGAADSAIHTSSPLKRSDAIMNLDQASLGSPVAKRRSLHGSASFGHDFNVFDHGPSSTTSFDIHDDGSHEYELSAASLAPDPSSYTALPRRSSSLRKSTLQQRHGEKTSWGRRQAALALAAQQMSQTAPEVSTPVKNTSRPRLSLDQFVPPLARDSPFNNQGSLPNASIHLLHHSTFQPHPLSRTMTTSSSNSSLIDESPTHVPTHFGEQPRPKLDFSKSLPIGALRPHVFDKIAKNDGTFETPQNYKNEKPHPAAFMSTGLVSKVNRNPEVPQASRGPTKAVPDTPCKKPFTNFATYPTAIPGSAIAKARHIRHSFGTPSTPFNPHGTPAAPETFGKGNGIFGSLYGRGDQRRGSFLSVDGYESEGSPNAKGDSQASDFEFPGTPTKQSGVHIFDGSPSNHRSIQASVSALGHGLKKRLTRTSSKLNLSTSQDDGDGDVRDGAVDVYDSPTTSKTRLSLTSSDSIPSFGKSRALRRAGAQTPTPLIVRSSSVSSVSPSSRRFAKAIRVVPASPLERLDFLEKRSPHTPLDSMLPPDPSGLSISNAADGYAPRGLSQSMPPPATPTGGRDYFSKAEARRLSMTPVSTFAATDMDHSLTSRFDEVESIGFGEFSHVYKVTQKPSAIFTAAQSFFNPVSTTPPSPSHVKYYAVKKARTPIHGVKDRELRMQEVHVLRALGKSDHVIEFFDCWEEKNLLYIQTEYCDEGSLDFFLGTVGNKATLDVFRTWKILLEISQGLRHIHESGFIHLDLKPANIFISFEGTLKIGDFGMASAWPAPPGLDREGDREYLAPEILRGIYDKPADVFALGIMLFEIASNVALPNGGDSWSRLRRGDTSEGGSLTMTRDPIPRDLTGLPLGDSDTTMSSSDDDYETAYGSPSLSSRKRNTSSLMTSFSHDPSNLFSSTRRGELGQPPAFMSYTQHPDALDALVQAMLKEDPSERLTVQQVCQAPGIQWVQARLRAGATVYEGEWGPADEILSHDSEMIDV